jgi:hypothetical protein
MRIEYYLHDDEASSLIEYLVDELGIDPELAEKAADRRPFYEVTLVCDLNEETGEVTLISAEL